jgi:hypothetical protein
MARTKMKTKDLQRLLDERNKLFEQMEALKNKISGLELAITLLEKHDDSDQREPRSTSGRGKGKDLIIGLLKEAGTTGLNAKSAVEFATTRNIELARGTAAATLSRLKAAGVVTYDGDRYRLVEFTRPKLAAVTPA